MIMKTLRVGMVCIALTVLMGRPALAQTGHDLLQQALVMEQAEGNLQAAIQLYERIVQDFRGDGALAARALVQMGQCYEKLGSQEAERAYQRVVSDYADQREFVDQARSRLLALTRPPSASAASMIQVRRLMGGHYPDSVEISGGPHPDGRQLVYVDWTEGSLAIRNLSTGDSRQITQGDWEEGVPSGAIVSPDGKLIAYGWYPNDAPQYDPSGTMLRLVGTDGSGDRFLQVVGGFAPGSWSRDSRHIAAHMHNTGNLDTEIVWISVEDGSITPIETIQFPERFAPNVSHSPDDRFLAVDFPVEGDSARYDIALVSTTGGGTIPLVDHPADDRLIGWVPGTDAVLFTSDRSGNRDLWAVRVSGPGVAGTPFPVRRSIGEVTSMGFTADGSWFFSIYTLQYVKSVAPVDEETGAIVLEESEPILGTHDNNQAAWSPDGEYLALAYREEGVGTAGEWSTIRVRNLDAGTERVLTREINPGTIAGPKWLPGGRSILTVGMDNEVARGDWATTPAGLFRIDVETGEVTRLFDFPPDADWWSKIGLIPTVDGKGVYYIHNRRLVHRDLESGTEEEFYRHPDLVSGTLAVSPDGSELLFGIAESTVTDRSPQTLLSQGGSLMVLPSAGGAPRELTKMEEPGRMRGSTWTSDGSHILFFWQGETGTALMRVHRGGGVPERVWETDLRLGSLAPSPDGLWVTYMTQTNEAEIWVMENLAAALRESGGGR